MKISSIVACGQNNEIGLNGKMPWNIPGEYNHFIEMVSGNYILMGRINWEDNINNVRLLKRVTSLVVGNKKISSRFLPALMGVDVHFFETISSALDFARVKNPRELFIIGGGKIYEQTMSFVERIYYSTVPYKGNADTYFPQIPKKFALTSELDKICNETHLKWKLKIYDCADFVSERHQKL